MRIDIAVFDGVDEMDALGPLEVFRSAASAGAAITSQLVTRTTQPVVTGAWGLRFNPDAIYEPGADILLVAGGGWAARAERGAWGEFQRGDWLHLLRQAPLDGTRIMAGVCTGTMLLAHAGIVGSRPATTHRAAWSDLEATGATLVRDRVVDDGDLVTSGGVTSGIDLALWLVERECSPDIAERVAARMEYPRVRPRPAPSS
jgi:transcriptional regulator GlxA family with amidase domain